VFSPPLDFGRDIGAGMSDNDARERSLVAYKKCAFGTALQVILERDSVKQLSKTGM
jgi:hypothetical protein